MVKSEYDSFRGRMTDPTCSSRIQGPCGDDMEFYLIIKDNIITDINYYTETGCSHTHIAGRAVAQRAVNKNIYDALAINPSLIIKEEELSKEGLHCSILATTTFYRAIAHYFLDGMGV